MKVMDSLRSCVPPIGLIICDEGPFLSSCAPTRRPSEMTGSNLIDMALYSGFLLAGHRLKSKDAKTSKMFDQLNTKRRASQPYSVPCSKFGS